MAVRALSLSGGGARGSFQLGALAALYDVYGFRPDVIAGTSVGSVNGIKLALAAPPVANDPTAILNAVAAGTPDAGLLALRALEAEWATFTSPAAFFTIQPAFLGTVIEELLTSMNAAPTGEPPDSATIGSKIDGISVLLSVPIVNLFAGPYIASELQKLRGAILGVLTENAVFNLDPVALRLNDPAKLTLAGLRIGTPVYLAVVALESGRLRYVDGNGNFTERDGSTPVMSALTNADIDAALDENLQPLSPARNATIKGVLARYVTAINAITSARATSALASTTVAQRRALLGDIARNEARGNYLLDALQNQVEGLRLTTNADPRQGVLASAAMPVFFDPIMLGHERYIDGGVREIIPMEIALRRGVTDVIGICCSSLELPRTDVKANAGLPAVGLRALTEIALGEVTFSDIQAVRDKGIPCTVIAPTFDVHGAVEVVPSLIEISTDYGWLRACDEMASDVAASRETYRRTSDIISTLRLRSYLLECYINENAWFYDAGATREPLATVRTYRWIIREFLATRARYGLPTHAQSRRWWTGWARDLRPTGPFGSSSVWAKLSAYSANGTEMPAALEVSSPDAYAPDSGSLVDAGNDRVYWMVRGAVFYASGETEQTTMRTPALVVPHATVTGLPRIPRGSHLLAEDDTPGEVWIIRNEKRYLSTPALLVSAAMAGQPVALVPRDGLAQIPDGGTPYWLGGLQITDNGRTPLQQWDPTPQVEGSSTTTKVGLTNFSQQPVTVSDLRIVSDQDGGGSSAFEVTAALPLTVAADNFMWVDALFHPLRAGAISGTVSVTCDDPIAPTFSVPLVTSAIPAGPRGELQASPSPLDFGDVRVGQQVGQNVTLTNVGAADLSLASLQVVSQSPGATFAIPYSLPTGVGVGRSESVYVSSTPGQRGHLTASLAVDAISGVASTLPVTQHLDISLTMNAVAPVVFVASSSKSGGGRFPIRMREMQRLDFGDAAPATTVLRTFWIQNRGDLPLTVLGVQTLNQSTFGIPDTSMFPAVIAVGDEFAVEANFLAPSTPGSAVASELAVLSDDPIRGRVAFVVAGRSSGPHVTVQPPELLDLDSATPPTAALRFSSDGTDPVTLFKVGLDNRDFVISGLPPMPATLMPGTMLTLSVSYAGSAVGEVRGRLSLRHDAGSNGETLMFLRAFIP